VSRKRGNFTSKEGEKKKSVSPPGTKMLIFFDFVEVVEVHIVKTSMKRPLTLSPTIFEFGTWPKVQTGLYGCCLACPSGALDDIDIWGQLGPISVLIKMHEGTSWAGPDGKEHQESLVKCNKAFLDCVELHKLTVFSPDAMLPKGSGTTSKREYTSPRGLVYASSSPGCNSSAGISNTSLRRRAAPGLC
jgi:hypothetical protein